MLAAHLPVGPESGSSASSRTSVSRARQVVEDRAADQAAAADDGLCMGAHPLLPFEARRIGRHEIPTILSIIRQMMSALSRMRVGKVQVGRGRWADSQGRQTGRLHMTQLTATLSVAFQTSAAAALHRFHVAHQLLRGRWHTFSEEHEPSRNSGYPLRRRGALRVTLTAVLMCSRQPASSLLKEVIRTDRFRR